MRFKHTLHILPLLIVVLWSQTAFGAANYTAYSETALETLQNWYNTTTGLWDTCGWWNGANCMTAIADLAAVDPSVLATATSVFATTFTQAPAFNPNPQVALFERIGLESVGSSYGDRKHEALKKRTDESSGWVDSCYDDDGWWALAVSFLSL